MPRRDIFGKLREKRKARSGSPNGFFQLPLGTSPIDGSNDTGYLPPDPPVDALDDLTDDPFHDGAVDATLRDMRSESLNNHEGDFWRTAGETGTVAPAAATPAEDPGARKRKLRKWGRTAGLAAGVLAALIAAFLLIFQITDITVQGNSLVDSQTIISLSGIKNGDNIFLLDEDAIQTAVNRNPYLIFVCL